MRREEAVAVVVETSPASSSRLFRIIPIRDHGHLDITAATMWRGTTVRDFLSR